MNWEKLLTQYKTNQPIQIATVIIAALLAYSMPGGAFFNILFLGVGLALGRFSFDDESDDIKI